MILSYFNIYIDNTHVHNNRAHCFCLQTKEILLKLKSPNSTLTEDDRRMLQNISLDLNAALQPSTEDNQTILPQDLKTVATFVETVAK